MLRTTWTGVITIPQGKPHQPKKPEKMMPTIWRLTPQDLQETSGLELQEVMINADHTLCALCTSTGPVRPHFGQFP